jgi:protein-tyrosine-phosphatase
MAKCIARAVMASLRSGHRVTIASAGVRVHTTDEHRAAVLALAPDVADRTHCLAETDIPEPSATSLDDHRRTATVLQQAVRARLAEQFS